MKKQGILILLSGTLALAFLFIGKDKHQNITNDIETWAIEQYQKGDKGQDHLSILTSMRRE